MTETFSNQLLSSLSKSDFKTHSQCAPALLRDKPLQQGTHANLKNHAEALRHLRQIYPLERRCFL